MTERPAHGARFAVERSAEPEADGTYVYRGAVHLPHADAPLVVRVAREGAVAVIPREGLSVADAGRAPELERAAQALVRAATRAPMDEGRLPPRRIVRWR